jgi:sugar O-acyltransferase (sialic acid O-acetyltransferase NeuD family)
MKMVAQRRSHSLDNDNPLVFVTDNPLEHGELFGVPIVGPDRAHGRSFVISVSNARIRRVLAEKVGAAAIDLIDNKAVIRAGAELGRGAVLCAFTLIEGPTSVGEHFHANNYAYVAHDCELGNFVTLGPKACINGNVIVEDDVYIGAGALVRQGQPGQPRRIGRGATVGMGAVVLNDVPPGVTVVGNPARPVRRR